MDKDIFIDIKEGFIDVSYKVIYNEEAGMFSAYMPGFDIYFSAPSEEEVKKRANRMIDTFFDFWIEQQGWKQLYLKIHKLGFRSKMHNLVMKDFLRNQRQSGKFLPSNIIETPEYFSKGANSKRLHDKAELAI